MTVTVRPYHVWLLLAALPAVAAWRLAERLPDASRLDRPRLARWAALAGSAPEELESGVTRRYEALAKEVAKTGARDVGYYSEKGKDDVWRESSSPAGFPRLERYYMAQSTLAPALLRFDETRALVVVDCATPELADQAMQRHGLSVVRDFGRGLVLARPGS